MGGTWLRDVAWRKPQALRLNPAMQESENHSVMFKHTKLKPTQRNIFSRECIYVHSTFISSKKVVMGVTLEFPYTGDLQLPAWPKICMPLRIPGNRLFSESGATSTSSTHSTLNIGSPTRTNNFGEGFALTEGLRTLDPKPERNASAKNHSSSSTGGLNDLILWEPGLFIGSVLYKP